MKRLLFLTLITCIAGQSQAMNDNGSSKTLDTLCKEHGLGGPVSIQVPSTKERLASYVTQRPQRTEIQELEDLSKLTLVRLSLAILEKERAREFEFKSDGNQKAKIHYRKSAYLCPFYIATLQKASTSNNEARCKIGQSTR